MIVTSSEMKLIEQASGIPEYALMERAGKALARAIENNTASTDRILILAGSGNNGGDGAVIAANIQRPCVLVLAAGKPKTETAQKAFAMLAKKKIRTVRSLKTQLEKADVIIDAVYGFGYHGSLNASMREIFQLVEASGKRVFSVDINSGAEADTGRYDRYALHSDITFALDCYKPFHMLRKDHDLFHHCELLSLDIPHTIKSSCYEMNEDIFFANFPKRSETAYKTSSGKTVVIGGCFGMAGAVSLNILGARTMGASYIEAAVPEEIYAITAGWHRTVVFHPFGYHTAEQVVEQLVPQAAAIVFGSGAVYMHQKEKCLDIILQNSKVPVVLDAAALRLLEHNTYILRFAKCPVILTPHIGEFAALINLPVETILDSRVEYAKQFAKDYHVTVVLKGPHTIIASPTGELYINQSGNQALAQAGSGDLLAGITAAILSLTKDCFTAVCMAVWIHGHLADLGILEDSIQGFSLERYPALMNALFKKHGL